MSKKRSKEERRGEERRRGVTLDDRPGQWNRISWLVRYSQNTI
jgi:hypothetical protein